MTRWSENRGLLDPSIGSRIRAAQQALGLPGLPGRSEIEPALFHIAADKKGNRSEGTVVGLTDIGEPALIRIEWDQLRAELASLED
jgi:3-dehydroquinate synthetase